MTDIASNRLPPEVLSELKQYKAHRENLTCLECGYRGMMGIKKSGGRPALTFFIAVVLTCVAAGLGASGVFLTPMIFGALLPLCWVLTSEPVYSCPSCKAELHR